MLITRLMFLAFALGGAGSALAQDCPASSERKPLLLERSDATTEIALRLPLVVAETRLRNGSSVKVTYYRGLIELDREQPGRVSVTKPKGDLGKFFPIKPNAVLRFEAEQGQEGQPLRRVTMEFAVVGARQFAVGDCRSTVWLIERRIEEAGSSRMRVVETFYFSEQLNAILAREHPERGGRSDIISYTRISR